MKSRRGFASMSPDRQKRIASLGGKAAHRLGKAHEWTEKEAATFGRQGGLKRAANKASKSKEK